MKVNIEASIPVERQQKVNDSVPGLVKPFLETEHLLLVPGTCIYVHALHFHCHLGIIDIITYEGQLKDIATESIFRKITFVLKTFLKRRMYY